MLKCYFSIDLMQRCRFLSTEASALSTGETRLALPMTTFFSELQAKLGCNQQTKTKTDKNGKRNSNVVLSHRVACLSCK